MTYVRPAMPSVLPSTPGLPPKCATQYLWLITAAPLSVHSAGENMRPSEGSALNTAKNSRETAAALAYSAEEPTITAVSSPLYSAMASKAVDWFCQSWKSGAEDEPPLRPDFFHKGESMTMRSGFA